MLTEKDMKMYKDSELKFKRWCRVNNKEESKESLMAYRKWQRESMKEAYEKVTIDIYLKTLSRQLADNFEKYNQDGYCTLDNFFKGTDFESYLSADAHLKGVVNRN